MVTKSKSLEVDETFNDEGLDSVNVEAEDGETVFSSNMGGIRGKLIDRTYGTNESGKSRWMTVWSLATGIPSKVVKWRGLDYYRSKGMVDFKPDLPEVPRVPILCDVVPCPSRFLAEGASQEESEAIIANHIRLNHRGEYRKRQEIEQRKRDRRQEELMEMLVKSSARSDSDELVAMRGEIEELKALLKK